MPQWDFLNFLAEHGRRLPTFHLEMEALVDDLIFERERVSGVRVATKTGKREVRAPLVVAADGRDSILRVRAQMTPREHGSPIDVLWLRLSRRPGDPGQAFGNVAPGGVLVTLDRGDYFQCAFVIQKGGFERIKSLGLDYLRQQISVLAPFLSDRVDEIKTFDDVKLLTVRVNRLPVWYRPGLLCIGDAAHAMSPIAGVGINLAIQDAVATANILAGKLRTGSVAVRDLAAVQKRREFPTKVIQGFQVLAQELGVNRVLGAQAAFKPPLLFRIFNSSALLRWLPAYFIGIGPRPEHVASTYKEQRAADRAQ
jgi:2-polyprenyl-6-methoxyphenol hydroxylase-like FAD-dependent oxidoreductase